jgi:CheY-like chemotaxis protein/two-component sensor histidine kinase
VDSRPTNFKDVLRSVSDIFSEVASDKKIRFVLKIDPDIPEVVECDQFRIIQILNNLLHNAFKFTNQGVVGLSVVCRHRTPETIQIHFSVHDTGIGIAEEHRDKIFKPFRQASTSTSREHGGTGLGLTIASRIVNLMGGVIEVESKQGVGTTFSFTLNFKISSHSVFPSAPPVKTRVLWQRQPVVLLVEDNEINREVAVNLLEYLGCEVVTADNGLSALKTVEKKDFDIILMDCQMPHMDGYEATRRIHEINGNHTRVPVIALTAHITSQDREKCFEAGMVDYMGKPYRVETLELLLCKWMSALIAGDKARDADTMPADEEEYGQDNHASSEIVHDLHNALTGIMGGAELALIYQNEPNQLEKQLKNILKAAKHAIKVTSDL